MSLVFAFDMGRKAARLMGWYPIATAVFVFHVIPAIDLLRRFPNDFVYYMMYNIVLGFPLFAIQLLATLAGMAGGVLFRKLRAK